MTLEKRFQRLKVHSTHIFGGFFIGVAFYYLFTMMDGGIFTMAVRFTMFLTMLLLGLSCFGEQHDRS